MFEREAHREKILEARNRELRLKLRQAAGKTEEEEEAGGLEGAIEAVAALEAAVFEDEETKKAEDEFYKTIEKELKKLNPIEDEEAVGPEEEEFD